MLKNGHFTLSFGEFIEGNKFKLKLLSAVFVLLVGIQFLPTITVKADVQVQGTTLTDEEYSDLLASVPEDYQLVSDADYNALSKQRATKGFFKNAHVQGQGWQGRTTASAIGTTGQSLRLEAIQLSFENMGTSISYQAHVQNIGWQKKVSNGATAGTTGQGLRMEAIQISTSGKYAVLYKGHVQGFGWERYWYSSSGGPANPIQSFAGTIGEGRRLEALQFKFIERKK